MFRKRKGNNQNLNSRRRTSFLENRDMDIENNGCRNNDGEGIGFGFGIGNRAGQVNRNVSRNENSFGQGKRKLRRGPRRRNRNISGIPIATYFKPNGISVLNLEVIHLGLDEFEALRLKNVEDLDQTEAAKKMEISQSTFARILDSAYKKISIALINGYAIEIES